jgi:hypothetical protein
MARLTDPETLAAYTGVLENWNLADAIVFVRQAQEFALQELGVRAKAIKERMHEFVVKEGGEVDATPERSDLYKDLHPFHYDLRFFYEGHALYAETLLEIAKDPFYSTIRVVKLKYQDEKLNRKCTVRT